MIITPNSTDTSLGDYPVAIVYLIFQIIILLWILIITFFTWMVLRVTKVLHILLNYYIVNLAFCGYILAATSMPFSLINDAVLGRWQFGKELCDLWQAFDVMCRTVLSWFIFVVILDRVIFYHDVIKYNNRGSQRALLFIVFTWATALLISIVGFCVKGMTNLYDIRLYFPQCFASYSTPVYVIYQAITSFFLPVVLAIILYILLFCLMRKKLHPKVKAVTSTHEPNILKIEPGLNREDTAFTFRSGNLDMNCSQASLDADDDPSVFHSRTTLTSQSPRHYPYPSEREKSWIKNWKHPKSAVRDRWRRALTPLSPPTKQTFNEDIIKRLPKAIRANKLPKLEKKSQTKQALSDKQYYNPARDSVEQKNDVDIKDEGFVTPSEINAKTDTPDLKKQEENRIEKDWKEEIPKPPSRDSGIDSRGLDTRNEGENDNKNGDRRYSTLPNTPQTSRWNMTSSHGAAARKGSKSVTICDDRMTDKHDFTEEDYYKLKLLAVVLFCYFFLWLPFYLTQIFLAFCTTCDINYLTYSFIHWIGYIYSGLCPFGYFMLQKEFRHAASILINGRNPNEDYAESDSESVTDEYDDDESNI